MSDQQAIRDRINDRLIEALAKNVLPWRRPWSSGRSTGQHRNLATGRSYSGVNPLVLELHCMDHGFGSNAWLTFNQAKALGCSVKPRPANTPPGRWGCTVVFCRPVSKTVVDQETGEEEKASFFVLRTFTVFNSEQCSGEAVERFLDQSSPPQTSGPEYPQVQELLVATKADVRHGGDRAFYRCPNPAGAWPHHTDGDFLMLPERDHFHTSEEYFKTALHELAHWSEVRLGWDGNKHGYAKGELVAEMASAYTATELGMPLAGLDNHAAYLKSWLDAMRESSSFIFRCSSQASRTSDYLLSFVRSALPEATEEAENPLAVAAC